MTLLPVDPKHRENSRDDGFTDFAILKAQGLVRDKNGKVVEISRPLNKWSALDRDTLYQAFCEMMKTKPTPEQVSRWVTEHAARLSMSEKRAIDIINEGNGEWPGANMRWWRGVSVT